MGMKRGQMVGTGSSWTHSTGISCVFESQVHSSNTMDCCETQDLPRSLAQVHRALNSLKKILAENQQRLHMKCFVIIILLSFFLTQDTISCCETFVIMPLMTEGEKVNKQNVCVPETEEPFLNYNFLCELDKTGRCVYFTFSYCNSDNWYVIAKLFRSWVFFYNEERTVQ